MWMYFYPQVLTVLMVTLQCCWWWWTTAMMTKMAVLVGKGWCYRPLPASASPTRTHPVDPSLNPPDPRPPYMDSATPLIRLIHLHLWKRRQKTRVRQTEMFNPGHLRRPRVRNIPTGKTSKTRSFIYSLCMSNQGTAATCTGLTMEAHTFRLINFQKIKVTMLRLTRIHLLMHL